MVERKRWRYWFIFIAVAVFVHLVLLLTVKPSFFSLFKKTISAENMGSPFSYSGENAILTISIEVEDEASEAVQPEQVEETDQQEDSGPKNAAARPTLPGNLEELMGEGSGPIKREPGPRPAVLPPRPVEITWPDTRHLEHCIGAQITVSIQVDEKGQILSLRSENRDFPADCIRAALEAAGKIVFEPGRINGVAMKMWTRIRIDFRRENP